MRELIATDYLPLVRSAEPWLNDHSRGHIERVLEHIEAILARHFPNPSHEFADIPQDRVLSWADTLILLSALVWHDIGNIHGRKDHGKKVRECFQRLKAEAFYDPALSDHIIQVAEAHSGPEAIAGTIPDGHAVGSYNGEDIHLQFLAAVLRFADALDEDHRRAAPPNWRELGLVPEASQRFWWFSNANSAVKVHIETTDTGVCYRVDIESTVPASEFDTTFPRDQKRIRALAEYFARLFELERERRYCNPYLRGSYYHPGIESTHVHLLTHERGASPASARAFEFGMTDIVGPEDLRTDTRVSPLSEYVAEAMEAG